MALSDRAITAWAASGSTFAVVVVGLVAALGGLADTPEPAIAEVPVGTPFIAAPLTVTVERADLYDAYPAGFLDAEAGSRIVVVTVDVVNTWDRAQYAGTESSLYGVVSIPGLAEPDDVVRVDDAYDYPALQPGVPVRLEMAWRVDDDRYGPDDPVEIALSDMTLYTASFVTTGQWWTDPVVVAVTRVPVHGAAS